MLCGWFWPLLLALCYWSLLHELVEWIQNASGRRVELYQELNIDAKFGQATSLSDIPLWSPAPNFCKVVNSHSWLLVQSPIQYFHDILQIFLILFYLDDVTMSLVVQSELLKNSGWHHESIAVNTTPSLLQTWWIYKHLLLSKIIEYSLQSDDNALWNRW